MLDIVRVIIIIIKTKTGFTFSSLYKNSSGDEIANVLVNDDIAHT